VITFDPIGISSHPNHASLAHIRPSNTSVYRLSSPAIWKKYTGPLPSISSNIAGHVAASPFKPLISSLAPFFAWLPEGIIAQIGGALGKQRGQGTINLVSTPERYLRGVRAMWEHRTQMVWFRYAYLVFSTLMWVNELVPVPME
jgi:N-acetylglucosaminylphosphatidylinositol deacetylase